MATLARAQTLQQNLWVADGTVNAMAVADGLIYLGGSFARVGPAIGSFVGIDSIGTAETPFAMVVGTVNTMAADGAGGWFIGGSFSEVQGQPRQNLAHLDASGTLTAWEPGTNSEVFALAVFGSTVYVGGNFSTLGGQSRFHLGAVDATSGAVTSWDPHPSATLSGNTEIYAITAYSGLLAGTERVVVGGDFNSVSGQTRNFLAMFDGTGALTTWDANADGAVVALAVKKNVVGSGTTIYAGGIFANMGGQARSHIAAMDAVAGAPTSWNPGADAIVRAILVTSGPIYAGGDFYHIGGSPRNHVAALDATSGLATSWDANADNQVNALAIYRGSLCACGYFSNIGGQTRNHLALIDQSTGAATSWDANLNFAERGVNVVASSGNALFVGGSFTSAGGVGRSGLAALDEGTGMATSWNPDLGPGGSVNAMAVVGGTLYVGGFFHAVGGQARNSLAAVDMVTGAPTSWNPDAGTGHINSLTLSGATVYVGGAPLTSIGGQPHNEIAAIDATSGAVSTWDPNVSGYGEPNYYGVKALLVSGSTLYFGGDFTSVGTQSRNGLAAVDATTGSLLSWDPQIQKTALGYSVDALALSGSLILVAGSYDGIGGRQRTNLGAVDMATALANSWDPYSAEYSEVYALAQYGSTLYVGGSFADIAGQPRLGLAAFDSNTLAFSPWSPSAVGASSFAFDGSTVYVGGNFASVQNLPHSCVAGLSNALVAVQDGERIEPLNLRAWPNPFRDRLALMAPSGPLDLEIFDSSGRRVRSLRSEPGGTITWNGRDETGRSVAAGLYFIRVMTGSRVLTAKVMRLQ